MSVIDNFEAMLARGQDSDMLRFTLGSAYWKDKQPEKALEHLRKAVELKPDYSAAWKILGRAHLDLQQPEDALNAFDQGLQAAAQNGDKQNEKEINVFRKRAVKLLDQ